MLFTYLLFISQKYAAYSITTIKNFELFLFCCACSVHIFSVHGYQKFPKHHLFSKTVKSIIVSKMKQSKHIDNKLDCFGLCHCNDGETHFLDTS
jgi:hypothetical protein